ncbi:MAG: YhdP family protein, partial [Pseudomonadota bacterium]
MTAAAKGLDLGMISSIGRRSGLLPGEIQQRLAGHRPSGLMERLALSVPDGGDWRFRGGLRNVSMSADGGAPSGSGLDGYIQAGPEKGRVTLEPGSARIGFPELFHTEWRFERLAGRVRWARRDDGWEVSSHSLQGRHEGMKVSGGFRLRLHEDSTDTLSLRVGVADGDTRLLGRLVPKHRVPPELYAFLTESIGAGTVTEGLYYGFGDVGEGSEQGAFTSSMMYRFRDTELAYHPDWPSLEGAAGRVHVQDGEGHVQLGRGRVAGVDLEPSQVRIVPADEGVRVDVDTAARREGELLTTQWRDESPLAETVGGWVRDLEVSGSNRVDLSLSLWPQTEREPAVDARLSLADTRVRFPRAGVEWRELEGPVRFRSWAGFSNTELEGRFMGEPVVLEIRDGRDQAPVFRQQGAMSVARLAQWLDRPLPRTEGQFDYDAAFRPTEGPSLRLDANLEDLVLDWPVPLAKEAGEEHSLTATVDFGGDGEDAIRIGGNWHPLGAFRFVLRDGAMERGRIGLGVRATDLPDEPVFSVTGAVPGFPLNQWWQALSDLPSRDDIMNAGQENESGTLLPPLRVSLGIREPGLNGWSLSPLQVEARAEPEGGWQVAMDSDWIQGTVGDEEEEGLSVDLERLLLPELAEGGSSDGGVTRLDNATMSAAAREWPEARVRIGRLVLGEREITGLSLALAPDGTRVRIDPLAFNMGDLALDGSLSWQPTADAGVTEFSGSLSGSDLQGLEALLGETTVPISSKRAEASLNLAWPGGPGEFSLARLRAAMDFRLENGIIDQDIEGARIFRVFSLLNTDTLWRRLQLDFSDVYESGIPFDHIEGEALIHEGRLIFDPSVVIQAPSGGFRMSGEADLVDEILDMRLVVVLPVTQNLPLAAVLFGYAPPIGGALFVIDKVFGGILSRVTSATYTVEGNWNDPDIELRNLFDTESDLDSYERP